MPRLCIFCSSEGPLTKEHLFPQWIFKELHALGLTASVEGPIYENNGRDPESLPEGLKKRTPSAPNGQDVAKVLCNRCNNEWSSSKFEKPMRLFYRWAMGVEQYALQDVPEVTTIVKWVIKTSMVFDAVRENIMYTKEERRQFYDGDKISNIDIRMIPVIGNPALCRTVSVLGGGSAGPAATVEIIRLGAIAFIVRRSSSGWHFLEVLARTNDFVQHLWPIYSWQQSTWRLSVTVEELENFARNPYGAAPSQPA